MNKVPWGIVKLPRGLKGTVMDTRYYPGVEADVPKLVAELRDLFDEDYEVQTVQVSSTTVVQARKSSTLRDLTGLSAALTIRLTSEPGGTRVEIGMQKWFDKAAIAAVALLLSAGLLAALPALGAYWQYKLTEDAWKIIEDHIARKGSGYVSPPSRGKADVRTGACAACGAIQKDASARFCNRCGRPLAMGSR
jgi:hypothetical protein